MDTELTKKYTPGVPNEIWMLIVQLHPSATFIPFKETRYLSNKNVSPTIHLNENFDCRVLSFGTPGPELLAAKCIWFPVEWRPTTT